MKTNLLLASVLTCMCISAFAEESKNEVSTSEVVKTEEVKKEEVKAESDQPKGKAIVQVFANFHAGFGAQENNIGFELERAYLGYEYKFKGGLSVKAVMDMGQSKDVSDNQRLAYIKNAMVSWKKGNLTLNGGLISTTQFNFQEKFWGYRYVMKSFQDQYKFGSSADLGISAAYKFADWISADAIIVNGEGYKKLQKNGGLNYGLGVTLTPIKGLQMRLYGGYNDSGDAEKSNIVNMAAFVGYKCDRFTIGAEYSHILNSSYSAGKDMFGYSIFASVKATNYAEVFARFDDVYSKDNWNISKDEQAAVIGAQFKLGKYVKIAPNFKMNLPKAEGGQNSYSAYVNCYFGF